MTPVKNTSAQRSWLVSVKNSDTDSFSAVNNSVLDSINNSVLHVHSINLEKQNIKQVDRWTRTFTHSSQCTTLTYVGWQDSLFLLPIVYTCHCTYLPLVLSGEQERTSTYNKVYRIFPHLTWSCAEGIPWMDKNMVTDSHENITAEEIAGSNKTFYLRTV